MGYKCPLRIFFSNTNLPVKKMDFTHEMISAGEDPYEKESNLCVKLMWNAFHFCISTQLFQIAFVVFLLV